MAKTEKAKAKEKEPEAEGEGEGAAPKKKKLAGKQLVLFIVLPALLVLGGGGAAAAMLLGKPAAHAEADAHGGKAKKDAKKDKKDKKDEHGGGKEGAAPGGLAVTEGADVLFVSLPEMLVNIAGADGRPAFLKLKLTLEAPNQEAVDAVEPEMPRIIDQFQGFLRELRVDDLAGSSGAYRVRLELLRRVNLVIAPKHVNSVLIEEMLIQ